MEALCKIMREEYEAINQAGFVIQLDCPDLAMARHTQYKDLSDTEFVRNAGMHVEILNEALKNVPADMSRLHLCWGNYEGPHDRDIPLAKIADVLCQAKPQVLSFEAANPRHAHEWTVWGEIDWPEDKVLMPGVIDTSTNYVEHPDYVASASAGSPMSSAASACSPVRTAASARLPASDASTPTSRSRN